MRCLFVVGGAEVVVVIGVFVLQDFGVILMCYSMRLTSIKLLDGGPVKRR